MAYECYTYCGFAYLPSLPWQNFVPPEFPPIQRIFQLGVFEFGTLAATYIMACVAVVLAMILLYATRHNVERNLIVIQVFFDILSFVILKKLTSVFACTGADVYILDYSGANTTSIQFCSLNSTRMGSDETTWCMDVDPEAECYTADHFWYTVPTMTLLIVPYFILALHLQSTSQEKQSVAIIDPLYARVSFQLKFFLAVLVSCFGQCNRWGRWLCSCNLIGFFKLP